jgi:hypothetical protein
VTIPAAARKEKRRQMKAEVKRVVVSSTAVTAPPRVKLPSVVMSGILKYAHRNKNAERQ